MEIGISVNKDITIELDNLPVSAIVKGTRNKEMIKHVNVKELFVLDHFKRGDLKLVNVTTKEQKADGMAKALTGQPFYNFRDCLGLRPQVVIGHQGTLHDSDQLVSTKEDSTKFQN
jgi:hypothetical protein